MLSEVYAALTWAGGSHPHPPAVAAATVLELVEAPSAIVVLSGGLDVALRHLHLAAAYGLTARRIHDARHAATALEAGVTSVYTYDVEDWRHFLSAGLLIGGPPSVLASL